MLLGICTSLANAAAARAAGWDYIEDNVQTLVQSAPHAAPLPILAANCLVPGSMKITGPDVDMVRLPQHLLATMQTAQAHGIKTLVFGSGVARRVEPGVDRQQAREQILDFCVAAGICAEAHGITIAIEPLHRGECNIINTLAEAVGYAKELDHPNVRCLVDSYHFWQEDEPLENLVDALAGNWIAHVHLADRRTRFAPRDPATEPEYLAFLSTLKRGHYDALMSVEASAFDIPTQAAPVNQFLRRLWDAV